MLVYGAISYAIFLATFLYAIGFVGNIVVPKSIDATPTRPLWIALLINTGLLALFSVQHSVMARPFFKRWITRHIPEAAERSTYTLAASVALSLVFWQWQPIGGGVWQVDSTPVKVLLHAGCIAGWLLVLTTTFLIHHFDLFGLRQVWLYFRNRPYTAVVFRTPGPYKSLSENSEGCCFRRGGRMARRDEGEYP